ncbi:hypothetical protein H4R18_000054 [Coemansia javaensis]|uniref:Rpr2-domain-containing protein n=1 Tax=Coemansia javaensis TaxID=2761396 RepID=A0A9W8LMP2_9FUNG|nr:hypothetical protein H4R18_000054 [Coemansia javaensis]
MAPRPLGEQQQELRASHLHTAAHAAFKICPQLASFYGSEFLAALGSQRTSNAILRQLCARCGAPLVDGRTVSRVAVVRAARATRRKRGRPADGGSGARPVVVIRPNELRTGDGGAALTREERAAQLRDRKNTVEYTCAMCTARIVYPGSTKSGLRAAGLCRGAPGAAPAAAVAGAVAPEAPEPAVRYVEKPAAKPALAAGAPGQRPGPGAAAPAAGAAAAAAIRPAAAAANKRKRHKSNLLAAVAASKKKIEDKRSAGSAFSLDDFLSGL